MDEARIIKYKKRRLLRQAGVPETKGIFAYTERVRLQAIEVWKIDCLNGYAHYH